MYFLNKIKLSEPHSIELVFDSMKIYSFLVWIDELNILFDEIIIKILLFMSFEQSNAAEQLFKITITKK